jgi:prepilin-type N-terminal cleavage/methylation domain-containing protein
MNDVARRAGHAARGFSLVELLIAIVLAGIIFGAMVPLFYFALKTTSVDAQRNDSQNLVVDRIEQVRLLNYEDITGTNLNSPPSPASDFGDGRFGPIYTVASGRPFHIVYEVVPRDNAQKVTVHVTRSGSTNTTTMTTVVKNPAPNVAVKVEGPTPTALPTTDLTITASFKDWRDVVQGSTRGVYYTRLALDTGLTYTSPHTWPTSTSTTVVWTGLAGGPNYTYTVYCYSTHWQSGNTPLATPPFHLLKSARPKFDTNPGGS